MNRNVTCVECLEPANGRHIWDCCGNYDTLEYPYSQGCGRMVHDDCLSPEEKSEMDIWQCAMCFAAELGSEDSSKDIDDYEMRYRDYE